MFGNKIRTKLSTGIGLATLLFSSTAPAGYGELNMPRGVTPISETAYDVHMLMLYVCIVIGVLVFGVMIYSIIYHRKAAGHEAAQFHHSTFAEIIWTVIPFIILVVFAVPATKGLIVMEDTSESDITIKVTGYQWLWKYEYLEDGVTLYSSLAPSSRAAIYDDPHKVENYLLEVDNEIVFPVGKKVRLLLTSADVIHAWWVPALGMKKDAIPGFINELWVRIQEPGIYRGQCAELCGKDHGFMPIVVHGKDADGYKEWVASRQSDAVQQAVASTKQLKMQALIDEDQEDRNTDCAKCNMDDGEGFNETSPTIKESVVSDEPIAGELDYVAVAAIVTSQSDAFGSITGDLDPLYAIIATRNL